MWIGAGESRAVELVAKATAHIAQAHPNVRVRIHSGNADDVCERVDKGLLDFGLVFGRDPERRYDTFELPYQDQQGVLVRRDDPLAQKEGLTLDDLRGRRIIASAQGGLQPNESDRSLQFFGREGFTIVATYTLLYNASLLVEQGVGVAYAFDGIVATGEGTPFAFVPLVDMPPVPSRLIWKRYQPLSRACELFLREFRAACEG